MIVGALGDHPVRRIRPTCNLARHGPDVFLCLDHANTPKPARRRKIYAFADLDLTDTTARLRVLGEDTGGGLFVFADEVLPKDFLTVSERIEVIATRAKLSNYRFETSDLWKLWTRTERENECRL
jgi:hypothetical protein